MMQRCTACEPFKAVEIWGIRPQLDAKILSVKITYGVCRMMQSLRRSKWPRRGQPAILMFGFLHSSGRIMFRVRFMMGEYGVNISVFRTRDMVTLVTFAGFKFGRTVRRKYFSEMAKE
ncbi:hypothetical protein I7I50_04870 [Histoplasma capsulatum G186AR]|nr:hypothetical protein I7I52_03128 [Histoplasma capsulatum]QSS75666.1 hypothetical protein I7I50_04870 [Histoplasma capsulatum G186AR]